MEPRVPWNAAPAQHSVLTGVRAGRERHVGLVRPEDVEHVGVGEAGVVAIRRAEVHADRRARRHRDAGRLCDVPRASGPVLSVGEKSGRNDWQ